MAFPEGDPPARAHQPADLNRHTRRLVTPPSRVVRTRLLAAARARCRTSPVACYGVLAFTLSWSYWWTLIARGQRVVPGGDVTHLPGLAGPFLAAVACVGIRDGWPGLRLFLRRCVAVPVPRLRAVALALSPLAAGAMVFVGVALLAPRGLPAWADVVRYPGAPPGWSPGLTVALALLLNGLGEEGGWRGYLLPELAARGSRLRAAVLVAGLWMLWHAPLFVLNDSMAALVGPALIGWAISLLAGSVLLAWLYVSTGSVLVVACWHTSFNFMVATPPGQGVVAAVLSTVVMVLAGVIAWRWSRQRPAPAR